MAGGKAYTDFRGEITFETYVWLEAKSRLTGRTFQDIVREELHKIAAVYVAEVKVAAGLLNANPAAPEDAGTRRSRGAAGPRKPR